MAFTTGPQAIPIGRISGAEWIDQLSRRDAKLSATPCDFTPIAGVPNTESSSTINFEFTVGTTPSDPRFINELQPMTTYYLNVKNIGDCLVYDSSSGNYVPGTCNMFIDINFGGSSWPTYYQENMYNISEQNNTKCIQQNGHLVCTRLY